MGFPKQKLLLFCAYLNVYLVLISATNHWMLMKDGTIQPQFDSPYYMKKPNDLFALINQTKYQEKVDVLDADLVLIKTDIRQKLGEVETYALGFLQQTKCMLQYYLDESDLMASIGHRKYMDLLYRDGASVLELKITEQAADLEPVCTDYLQLDYSMSCFEHLNSMIDRGSLKMEPEDPLKLHELGIITDHFANMLVSGLQEHSLQWQYYALSSYYWRLKGNAPAAVECARRAIYLAPRVYKDVPLLSLGTTLQRGRQHEDAIVVLEAATELNPRAINYFALGNSHFLANQFVQAMHAYDMAVSLDDTYKARVDYIENALQCFKYAKTKLDSFDALIRSFSEQLKNYDQKKGLVDGYLNQMQLQQVPLGEREYFKRPDGTMDVTNENLAELVQQRGQYCSTRISQETNEPELFCDFVNTKLEVDEIRTDIISSYLEQTAELMKTAKGSLGVFYSVDVNTINDERFISDKFALPRTSDVGDNKSGGLKNPLV